MKPARLPSGYAVGLVSRKARMNNKITPTEISLLWYATQFIAVAAIYLYVAGLAYARAYFGAVGLGHLADAFSTYNLMALSGFAVRSLAGWVLLGFAIVSIILLMRFTQRLPIVRMAGL